MIESVRAQTYPYWELCIAEGGSKSPQVRSILRSYLEQETRIKVIFLEENLGIAGNTNAALKLARGEFVAFLDHDDLLAPFALFEVVKLLNEDPEIDFIYSDEDKITPDGERHSPFFKPDFSPDLLRSVNYICHLVVIRKRILEEIGGLRSEFEGAQDYDLVLRVTEKTSRIRHIPKILYHWREHPLSTAQRPQSKKYAYESGRKALEEHLKRIGRRGQVYPIQNLPGTYRVKYDLHRKPLVSILIPNKDNLILLKTCIESIVQKSTYRNFEVIIIENNSTSEEIFDYYKKLTQSYPFVKVETWEGNFNWSAINNWGVARSRGDVLLFLNNDTEVINPDWLESMLEHLQWKEVGVVGAKLYYPDNTIQHAGVIVGLSGVAGHSHKYYPRDHPGYFGRLLCIQNLSAVTGACMMVKRRVFEEVGGFEERLPVAFNDVDFCLKVRQRGYLIVWTPFAELYHHESKTRGAEDTPSKQARFLREIEYFRRKWKDFLDRGDPYYNINLTLNREDFSLNLD